MNKEKTHANIDTRTNEDLEKNDETSDNEYGYYNPKDKDVERARISNSSLKQFLLCELSHIKVLF